MSQRPTGAEADARREQARAVRAAVQKFLADNAARANHQPKLFFVTLGQHYRKRSHPVLGEVDVDAVLGLRADNLRQAEEWAMHWLGMRGYADVIDQADFEEAQRSGAFPSGCPQIWDVPPALHYTHTLGSRIIVWEVPHEMGHTGEIDAYTPTGKRKATTATPTALEEGHGAWRETWFSFDGEELTMRQVNEIAIKAGVY